MLDELNSLIISLVGSPWAYLVIVVTCAVDAFLPVVPGEAVVISAGVLARAGEQALAWIIVTAAVGSFAGDHVSYAIGRTMSGRMVDWLLRGRRGQAARAWAQRVLNEHGGVFIVAARFVPGGRTATTLTAGTLGYPVARFAVFTALAASAWAAYAALIGLTAGAVFEGNPLLSVAVGLCVAMGIAGLVEPVRFLLRRRRRHRDRTAGTRREAPSRPCEQCSRQP